MRRSFSERLGASACPFGQVPARFRPLAAQPFAGCAKASAVAGTRCGRSGLRIHELQETAAEGGAVGHNHSSRRRAGYASADLASLSRGPEVVENHASRIMATWGNRTLICHGGWMKVRCDYCFPSGTGKPGDFVDRAGDGFHS